MRRRISYLVVSLTCVALLVLGSLFALATSPRLSASLGQLLAGPLGSTPVPYLLTNCAHSPLLQRWTCATRLQAVSVQDPASGNFFCGKSLPAWQMPRRDQQLRQAADNARQNGLPIVCPP
jgi:hypothetical protein